MIVLYIEFKNIMFPWLSTGEVNQITGGKNLPPDSNGPAQNLHTVFTCTGTKILPLK